MGAKRRPKSRLKLSPVEGLKGAGPDDLPRIERLINEAIDYLNEARGLGTIARRAAIADASRVLIGPIAHAAYHRLDGAALGSARTLLAYGDGPEAWSTGPLPAFLHTPSTREIDKAIRKIQSWKPKPAKHPAARASRAGAGS